MAEAFPEQPPRSFVATDDSRAASYEAKAKAAELAADGDLEGALAAMTEALMGNPSPLTFAKRGELLIKLGRHAAAVRDCDAALRINPDSAKSFKIRGRGACADAADVAAAAAAVARRRCAAAVAVAPLTHAPAAGSPPPSSPAAHQPTSRSRSGRTPTRTSPPRCASTPTRSSAPSPRR